MKNNLFNKRSILMTLMLFSLLCMTYPLQHADAFSEQVIQHGATGEDVVELQSRLQYIGFYNGKIDGVFGWGTYWAVRNYQYEFGMDIDGLVGPKMKNMLAKSTNYNRQHVQKSLEEGRKFTHYGGTPKSIQKGEKGSNKRGGGASKGQQPTPNRNNQGNGGGDQGEQQGGEQAGTPENVETPSPGQPAEQGNEISIEKATNVPAGYSDNDIRMMAQAVYGEARGEPYIGQVAVAAVILNRVNSPTFPNTVSDVIFEPRAFTAVADGQIWLEPNEISRRAVLDAINGQDPTGNALYYFNPNTATSGWIWTRPQIKQIGKHIFCH
ncbi:spore cortex-lytic enzyme [Alkalihalobacillus trypoxylicola]|uniref:Spore cortex-lytic enzyme n=1 Tax=Alkalihalobacillus trypoxylicola TaxID=519424 RepID=A0A162EKE5_9BACI|nr:spore cortex-lytic enzyme [Alkalihalobacillus trypoxylicola]KYG33123.1 spore cortex-lytic enzyme [Alkalihalobacillus trypoxylicola]